MAYGSKKLEAFRLRKEKKSYRQIAEQLSVSKSTVSCWFKDINWSNDIKKQLNERNRRVWRKRLNYLIKLRKIKYQKLYKQAEKEAIEEFEKFKNNFLFIAGINIYWAEGDGTIKNGNVRVANTDYRMLRIFKDFLVRVCNIDKGDIKSYIVIYPDLDHNLCVKFWSRNLGISRKNFYKPTIIQGRHKTRKIPYGTCTVLVVNKYLKTKILKWIDLIAQYYIERE